MRICPMIMEDVTSPKAVLNTNMKPSVIRPVITMPVIIIPTSLPTRYCVLPSGFESSVDATPSLSSLGISNVIDTAIRIAAIVFSTRDTSTISCLCIPIERIS